MVSGIVIKDTLGRIIHFRPRIEAIVADNLAKVKIAAFVQSWHAGKGCGVCWTDFADFSKSPLAGGYEYRDLKSVKTAIESFKQGEGKSSDRTKLGVTGYKNGFNRADPDFDICSILAPDIFHD